MAKMEFKFERGGLFVVDIFDKKVPKTWECIKAVLPITRSRALPMFTRIPVNNIVRTRFDRP